MATPRPVLKEWDGVNVMGFDPYKKALQMRLIELIWSDDSIKSEIIANPKAVFERESGVIFPESTEVQVLEEGEDTFYLVIPPLPPTEEKWERFYEQMSVWWTLGYTWWYWMYRTHGVDSRTHRELMEILFIVQFMQNEQQKKELFDTPNAAVEKKSGLKLPADLTVKPLQETDNLSIFVLPKKPQDEQLPAIDTPEGISKWWRASHTWFWWMASLPIKTDMGLASVK